LTSHLKNDKIILRNIKYNLEAFNNKRIKKKNFRGDNMDGLEELMKDLKN
jgi:hypothetical protein